MHQLRIKSAFQMFDMSKFAAPTPQMQQATLPVQPAAALPQTQTETQRGDPQGRGLPQQRTIDAWRKELQSGRSPKTGRPISNARRVELVSRLQDIDQRMAAGERPAPSVPPPAPKKKTPAGDLASVPTPAPPAPPEESARMPGTPETNPPGWQYVPGREPATPGTPTPVDYGDEMERNLQTAEEQRQQMEQAAGPGASPASVPAPPGTPTPPATNLSTIADISKALFESSNQFGKVWKEQGKLAQPALQQVYNLLNRISKAPNIQLSPDQMSALQQLVQTIQGGYQGENQDIQILHNIANQAQQVARMFGLNPAEQNAAARQTGNIAVSPPAGQRTQTPPTAPPATPTQPSWVANPQNKGWGSGLGGWVGNVSRIPSNFMEGLRRSRGTQASAYPLTARLGSAEQVMMRCYG